MHGTAASAWLAQHLGHYVALGAHDPTAKRRVLNAAQVLAAHGVGSQSREMVRVTALMLLKKKAEFSAVNVFTTALRMSLVATLQLVGIHLLQHREPGMPALTDPPVRLHDVVEWLKSALEFLVESLDRAPRIAAVSVCFQVCRILHEFFSV